MSYYFQMNFKKVKNDLEAFQVIKKASEYFLNENNFKKYINDNKIYYEVQLKTLKINIDEIDKLEYCSIIEDLIEKTTKIYCCYWPEYKALGISGNVNFDINYDYIICFQNSCDQDYPYSSFKGLCDDIDKEIENIQKMSAKKLAKILDEDVDYIKKDIDYHKRTYIYKYVYKLLDLDNWLWKKTFKKENAYSINLVTPVAFNHFELYE